jgi:hypothetical protein
MHELPPSKWLLELNLELEGGGWKKMEVLVFITDKAV